MADPGESRAASVSTGWIVIGVVALIMGFLCGLVMSSVGS